MTMHLRELGLSLCEETRSILDRIVEIRRVIHRYPEPAHQEERTAELVTEELRVLGISTRRLGATGVLGVIEGDEPGPTVLLRADMDALPMAEEGDLPFKSENDGYMHACGHDAHTAMLLGAARVLSKQGIRSGTVKLLFQPAEEGGGGASLMIDEGALEDPPVDKALAIHVWSPFATGTVVALDGPVAASVDGFEVVIRGRGTHAATPEDGADPIIAAAQIIAGAQSILTRRKRAMDPAVLSFTSIHGGTAFNIIPSEVRLKGTLRSFDNTVRQKILEELWSFVGGVSRTHGCLAEHTVFESLGPTINSPEVAGEIREVAGEIVGKERVLRTDPLMVGEDMGLILEKVPGALILIGCGDSSRGVVHPHHHPRFDVDERALAVGTELFVRFVQGQAIRQ